MLKNYLIIAWRNLWKHKMFSLINLTGLTISISVALVVYLIVQHEFSFDTYHKDSARIHRVVTISTILGDEYPNQGVPIPFAEALGQQVTGIEEVMSFFTIHDLQVSIPSGWLKEKKVLKHKKDIILADPNYFNIFEYQWLAGDPETALDAPFKVVLTKSRVKNYFNLDDATDAVGREIVYRDSIQTVVTGVVKDIAELTDFDFKEFISISTVASSELKDNWYLDRWDNVDSDFQLFVKLTEGVASQTIEAQFPKLAQYHTPENDPGQQVQRLQSLSDIHFNSEFPGISHPSANKSTLAGLLVVALLLLSLGAINYINLTTARSNQRSMEIGVRKTFGGSRKQLIVQFVTETVLLSFLSALSALLLVPLIMELFSDLIPAGLMQESIWQPHILLFLLVLTGMVGCLTGLYPGLVLSRHKPVWIMKNSGGQGRSRKAIVQQSLTVIQFTVAVFFVVSTLIVVQQIRYALNKDMGFNKEAIITFFVPASGKSASDLLLDELNAIPEIEQVSRGAAPPASTGLTSRSLKFNKGGDISESNIEFKYGDDNYLSVYGIPLIAGRNISTSDTIKEFLINESYLHHLGISEPTDVLGQLLDTDDGEFPIVGVVSDFHTKPISQFIAPTVITNAFINNTFHIALERFNDNTDPWQSALAKIESAWKTVYPDEPFTYQFYDQRIAGFYQRDQHTAKLLQWTTGIAIFISCLGLLGLAVFIANQKTKEIGVRKVLGASIAEVMILISKDFFKLVIIAILLGLPVAWYFITQWLQNFAYPIDLRWWMFVTPAILVLLVALITISSQVLKAAWANPVDSLRNE